jgi:hypothetical protein
VLVVIARYAFGSTGSCIGVPQADLTLHVPQGQSVGTVRRAPGQRRSWRHGQLDGMSKMLLEQDRWHACMLRSLTPASVMSAQVPDADV